MSEDVKVQIELDKLRAETGLRDLARQLNSADQLLNQLKRTGVVWAEDFKKATEKARNEISKLGTIASAATDEMIKGNKQFAQSFDNITKKVNSVQNSITGMARNFAVFQNAAKVPATSILRDDNEKRRTQYMSKLQSSYLKEQAALSAHNAKLDNIRKAGLAKQQAQMQARARAREQYAAMERQALRNQENAINGFWQRLNSSVAAKDQADKLKRIKQLYIDLQRTSAAGLSSTASLGGARAVNALLKEQAALSRQAAMEQKKRSSADREAAQNQLSLAAAGKRVTTVNLAQAGSANRLSASWKLAKQEIKETISVANAFQSAARGLTAVVGNLVHSMVDLVKTAPTLASDMLGYRNALALVTGDQKEASKLLNTAINIAVKLKLAIVEVTKQYSKFTNAATIAGLSVQQATDTFEDFAIAARVLNLNQERTAGMFLALEQMISKGRVSMEELRRQLGEHIPGALNLAATAMGYGTDELGKFIKEVASGNVVSTELVTKLGKLIKERTLPQLASSLMKFSAAAQDLANAFDRIKLKLGAAMSAVLVPMIDTLAKLLHAMANLMPGTEILGDESAKLASQLDAVDEASQTVTQTMDSVATSVEKVAGITTNTKMTVEEFSTSLSDMNVIAMGSIGILGASGLGGAFVALKKAMKIVTAGLVAFLAPFKKVLAIVRPLIPLFGKAGLAGAIALATTKLKALMDAMRAYAVIALMMARLNPFTAIAAGVVTATVALWSMVDANTELEDRLNVLNEKLNQGKKEAAAAADKFEELATQMADLGRGSLAEALINEKQLQEKAAATLNTIQGQGEALEDNLGFMDKFLRSWGYTTDAVEESIQATEELSKHAEHVARFMEHAKNSSQSMQLALDVQAQEASLDEAYKWMLNTSEERELRLKISTVGADDLAARLKEINFEFDDLIAKARMDNKGPAFESEVERINNLRALTIELAKAQNAYRASEKAKNAASAAAKALDRDYASLEKSINTTIKNLEKQNAQIGMTKEELAKSNAQFQIAALQEQILGLETKATTQAMRERIETMRQQVSTLQTLHAQNAQLTTQEERRQAILKKQEEMAKKNEQLKKEGMKLLESTLTLEEKFQKRVQELTPALRAAGATNTQVTTVMQAEWRKLVDDSNTGLKSIEAITEEVAKGMQNSFSDFFFSVMEGEFDNLADNFTRMLNRMVADAAASQLSQYLMGAGSTGQGFMGKILGTGIGTALGVGPSMPAFNMGGGGTTMGNFVGSAAGPGMSANQFAAFGFAQGGSFKVGGSGGTDSQVVAFKASPNERVTVETPAQQKMSDSGGNGAGRTQNISVVFNVNAQDANSFNSSRGQMEMQLREMVQRAGRNT